MGPLPRGDLRRLILRLLHDDPAAWVEFIEHFAPLLLQAARSVERNRDAAADTFVFTCERLRDPDAARLGTFDFEYPGPLRRDCLGLPSTWPATTAGGGSAGSGAPVTLLRYGDAS